MDFLAWSGLKDLPVTKYRCWHCASDIAGAKGFVSGNRTGSQHPTLAYIYICHACGVPTYKLESGELLPGSKYGLAVTDITDTDVLDLYEEAKNCTLTKSYTAVVLLCRKILAHVAVAKGAEGNLSFISYVTFLQDQHYIPPDAEKWVNHIREKGNEANHEIKIMRDAEAKAILDFTGMLLALVYQYPARFNAAIDLSTDVDPTE